MGGLGEQKQFVDGANVDMFDSAEVHAQAQVREQGQHFFAADHPGVRKQRPGAPDFIVELVGALSQKSLSGLFFVGDDLRDDGMLEVGKDFLFGSAEGGLVGDLVEIAESFGAFAEKPADSQVHIASGASNFFDFTGELECRQVEHDRNADACADVGGASSEIAEAAGVGVVEFLFEDIIDVVDLLPGLAELHSRAENLHAQVVFLIDHDGEGFVAADGHGAGYLVVIRSVLSRDEVSFDQQFAIEGGAGGQVDPEDVVGDVAGCDLVAAKVEHFVSLALVGAVDEGESGDVACQAYAGGDDDIAMRTGAAKPFAGMLGHFAKAHDAFSSTSRISSRRRAASS